MPALVFNLAVLVADLLLVRAVHRRPHPGMAVAGLTLLSGLAALLAIALVALRPLSIFGLAALTSWFLFLHGPPLLAALAWILRKPARRFASGLAAAATVLALVGLQGFVIEPRWLEVSHHRITSDKVTEPLRIVLFADLQTDGVGRYERRALRRTMELEPDLVVLSGDYLQVDTNEAFLQERAALRAALEEVGFGAPRGVFAVRGDVDAEAWATLFDGRESIRTTEVSARFEGEVVTVTALSPTDARSEAPPVRASDRFHVVVGHDPRFALARPPADLLLAGHTHGGQVQIPGFGPLVTLTTIPRRWAGGGLVELPWGGHLVVSRGVGLERLNAPRVRFLCRPEIVVVDVLPEG